MNDHGEVPKRLTPSKEITGLLFLMSGNRCAYPGCGKPILQRDGLIDGEIAHICAPVAEGPRYDPTRSNEQNRTLENLILLCNKHHKAIDLPKNLKVWSVDRLREVKADHEKIYTGAIDHLRSAVMDVTASQKYKPASNGELLFGADFTDEELRVNLEHLNRLGERLADLPTGPRSVLVLILHRGKVPSWSGVNDDVRVDLSILNAYADCTEGELIDHLKALEHANLGYFDVEEFGAYPPMFVAAWSTPEEVGWPIFADLKALDVGDGEIIRRAVLGLDLSVLDS